MKTIKLVFGLLFVAISALALYLLWDHKLKYHTTALRREVTAKIEKSKDALLDFRDISSVEWDEAAYWGPYMNICDLAIKGYEPEGPNCSDNGEYESSIIFLSQNMAIEIVPVERWNRSFDGDMFKRLPRNEMVFHPVDLTNGYKTYRPAKKDPPAEN